MLFTAFITGLFCMGPVDVQAQKGITVRPTWVMRSIPKPLPVRWHPLPPVRAWKEPVRPNTVQAAFPVGAVTNQTVWQIPRAKMLSMSLLATQVERRLFVRNSTFPGKQEIDAVIFDLDGTLLDSLSAWEHSGSNFVRSQGFEPPADLDDKLVAMSLTDGAKLIKQTYHLSYSPEEILELTLRPIKEHYYTDIQPMPGIPETLARLHAQGIKMAVATASDRDLAEKSLTRLGLRKYFEFIITCDEVGAGKSSPAVYEAALKRLGTAKARTLVAEDALHALQTAHHAGFPTAGIEEAHSASQRADKLRASTYYVFSYSGNHVFLPQR